MKADEPGRKFWTRAATSAVLAAICLWAPRAAADEYEFFVKAKNAYEAGEYEEAVKRFESLLEGSIDSTALLLESHKLLAVSYLFVGDEKRAEHHFTEMLMVDPKYELDPLIFPISVLDFFVSIKQKNQERLDALVKAREKAEAQRRAQEAARRTLQCEQQKRNIYIERERRRHSLVVAMIPFGAGQFQNGHVAKGIVFLSGEVLLSAAVTTTFVMHERLRTQADTPFESRSTRRRYERFEASYRIANQVTAAALGAAVVAGIIDALFFYEPEAVVWKRVEEPSVPEELRFRYDEANPKKTSAFLAPLVGENIVGLGLMGRF